MKKYLLYGFIIVAVVSVLVSVFVFFDPDENIQAQSTKIEKHKLGDKVQAGNLNITLNQVRKGSEEEKGRLRQKGDFILYCSITIENKGDEYAHISSLGDFKLLDSDGLKYNVTTSIDHHGYVDGEIPPHEKLNGELAFDVTDSEQYELIHKELFSDSQTIWKFGNNDIKNY